MNDPHAPGRTDGGRTRPGNLDRRAFLALGSVALIGAVGPRADAFDCGVASGAPRADGVTIWTRLAPEASGGDHDLSWELTDAPEGRAIMTGRVTAKAEHDYCVHVRLSGLMSRTAYWYRFRHATGVSRWGRTRTLPKGDTQDYALAVVSCSNLPSGYFHAYGEIARRDDIDLVVHLGDYIYEYGPTGFGTARARELGRVPDPGHDILTIGDYRARYRQYRRDPDLQDLHARHPMVSIWDDHEIANDAWPGGAQNHGPGQGSFDERRRAAQRAYLEWMPTGRLPRGKSGPRLYRSFTIGDLAELVLLDTRMDGRDRPVDRRELVDTPSLAEAELSRANRRMISARQALWAERTLAKDDTRWKIVASQNPICGIALPRDLETCLDIQRGTKDSPLPRLLDDVLQLSRAGRALSLDTWDGYTAERARFLSMVARSARNPIFLGGDIHTGAAALVRDDRGIAVAAEFITPSVTSPGFYKILPVADVEALGRLMRAANPHIAYIDGRKHGWLELHLSPSRTRATFWNVDSVTQPASASAIAARYIVPAKSDSEASLLNPA